MCKESFLDIDSCLQYEFCELTGDLNVNLGKHTIILPPAVRPISYPFSNPLFLVGQPVLNLKLRLHFFSSFPPT